MPEAPTPVIGDSWQHLCLDAMIVTVRRRSVISSVSSLWSTELADSL